MKRFLSILLVVLMLIPVSVLSVVADTAPAPSAQSTECTISKENIAGEASILNSGPWWAIDESILVDGKISEEDSKVAHSPQSPKFSWTFKFGKPYEINEVKLYVNGTGACSKCGYAHTADKNSVQTLQILLYDDTGAKIYESEVEQMLDGETPLTEATFTFPNIKVATVEIKAGCNCYGGAYFREVEIYKEVGAHAWTLNEAKSVAKTCTQAGKDVYDCACGATKTDNLGKHTVTDWEVVQQPTTSQTGMAEGPCTVPGCGGVGSKALPRLYLSDNEISLTPNNFDVKEKVMAGDDLEAIQTPNENRDVNDLFDGIIETATWQPGNFWCGTGWEYAVTVDVDSQIIGKKALADLKDSSENVIIQKDGAFTQEIVDQLIEAEITEVSVIMGGTYQANVDNRLIGTVTAQDILDSNSMIAVPAGTYINAAVLEEIKDAGATRITVDSRVRSTLTITFDQVYTLTAAEIYVWSNDNGFEVSFIGADGTVLKSANKSRFAASDYYRMIFTGEVYGLDVKQIVITINNAKWAGGSGLAFTEIKLSAHECLYDEADIAAGTKDGCVTTFNGKCIRCEAERVGAKVIEHTFQKDETNPTEDKIVEVVNEVTCYSHGTVKKHCVDCDQDVPVMIPATGNHEFTEEVVVLKPDCGHSGISYEKCATKGCPAVTAEHETPPQGSHNFEWKEKEDEVADYTHDGVKVKICKICQTVDETAGTQVSPKKEAKICAAQDWTIRYTDYVSPRATFKVNLSSARKLEDEGYDVKIYGVVEKGEAKKEVQVYGEGKTGNMTDKGVFSLVVKNGAYSDEYKFYAKVVVTDLSDNTTATTTVTTKALAGNSDGTVCVYDIAKYYINSESRASKLEETYGESVKNFYAELVEKSGSAE